jgi:hypothetical protein
LGLQVSYLSIFDFNFTFVIQIDEASNYVFNHLLRHIHVVLVVADVAIDYPAFGIDHGYAISNQLCVVTNEAGIYQIDLGEVDAQETRFRN